MGRSAGWGYRVAAGGDPAEATPFFVGFPHLAGLKPEQHKEAVFVSLCH